MDASCTAMLAQSHSHKPSRCSSEELAAARELLAERWYVVEAEVPEDRWRVETQLATGCASRPVWEASPFLKQVLQVQSKNWLRGYPSGGVALDLGCGPGREAVLLAQRLGSAWRVIACDNHEAALRRTEWLATKEGVKVETLQVNLRKDSILHMQADLVHGCRFLDRPLLEDIRKHLVRPGGLVVWSTFLQGSSQIRNGRSLEEGELADVFERDGTFRVLQDEKGVLTTGSGDAEANFFVAQRLTQQHV